jgi:hypothetical protein
MKCCNCCRLSIVLEFVKLGFRCVKVKIGIVWPKPVIFCFYVISFICLNTIERPVADAIVSVFSF